MTGSALILRADALRLPLPDESVDLIVSSPPYFALRSYRDGDEHYAGQIGSEPTPQAFLEALWAVMHECWRVIKPNGSCFINLGDKRAGSGGHNNAGLKPGGTAAADMRAVRSAQGHPVRSQATRRNAPDRYNQAAFGRPKSKMLLPHRFAIGCEDGLADPEGKGWVVRSDIVWQKLNGLPESVTDRCRDSHEYVFHLTKSERYFAAVDEVRMPHVYPSDVRGESWRRSAVEASDQHARSDPNPLGKLPGSVWPLPSEPLIISDEVKAHYDLPDHFAAFPTELVRRIILGWSPSGVCVECGEGRRPVVAKKQPVMSAVYQEQARRRSPMSGGVGKVTLGADAEEWERSITGYVCSCTPFTDHPAVDPNPDAARGTPGYFRTPARREFHFDAPQPPTRPAVVLDIFGGTGTTAGVARALGRIGVSVDLSHDYSRLARWRIERSGHFAKAVDRTNRENQTELFGTVA